MNILLVDDDAYVLELICRKLNWEELGIQRVFTALSARQAKVLLKEEKVDILLTDIEMPEESGLALLEWVRNEKIQLEALFLTSYAEFAYAQKAIELKSMEYYLKPVDEKLLSEGIMRAAARRREQERLGSVERQNAFLQEHSHLIAEQFWTELMRGAFDGSSDSLRMRIQKDRLQIDPKAHYTIVLLRVLPVLGRDIDEYLRVYGPRFKKELLEFYQDTYYQTVYSFIGSSGTLGLCLRLEPEVMNLMDIRSTAWRFIECMERREQTQIVGIVGSITDLYGIFSEFVKLRRLIAEQIDTGERVLSFPEAKYERKIDYNMPDLEIWESLLSNGGCDSLRSRILDFLEQRAKKKQLDRYILKMFRMDIEQLIYRYLRDRHVEMHKLFDNREAQKLADLSVQSVGCMKQYADYLIERSMEYTAIAEQPISLVEQAREYLDAHYCEPISRNDLTDVVYLNQDYLSRLFKKETGLSINAYLIEKRIDKAKKLLTESTLPVHAVSMEVGYSNFAYFSKLFREKTGQTPNEFRRGRCSPG